MARRPNIIRPVPLTTHLPEDVRASLDLHLFSQVDGCVPPGAYQKFFVARIKEFFSTKAVDISEYFNRPAGTFIVKGTQETCELVVAMILSTSEMLAAKEIGGG